MRIGSIEQLGVAFRLVVDALVVASSLMAAFVVRLIFIAYVEAELEPVAVLDNLEGYISSYALTVGPLSALVLAALAISGAYSPRKRGDRIRNRVLRVVQATVWHSWCSDSSCTS